MRARGALSLSLLSLASLASLAPGCDGDVAYIGRQVDSVGSASCAPACGATAGACGLDYCASLPRLSGAPRIDGILDCGLALASIDLTHWHGPDAKPGDLSADYAAAWTDGGIYVFVHVRKSQRAPAPAPPGGKVYCGDAVHVFVDSDGHFAAPPAYDDRGTRQLVAEAPASDSTSVSIGTVYATSASAPGTGVWTASRFRTFPASDGYVLETVVTAEDLALASFRPAVGQTIGFDLSVSYGGSPSAYPNDPSCLKRGDFLLRAVAASMSESGLPHDDVNAFCTPTLGAAL